MRRNVLRFMLMLTLCLMLPLCAGAEQWGLDFSQPVDNPMWLALTNAAEPLSAGYEPANMSPVSPKMEGVHLVTSRAVLVEEEALSHLYEMVAAAQAQGVELFVRQGYRSFDDEARRYKSLISAGTPAQAAGQSSYQTGLSVTLVGRQQRTGDLTAEFAMTAEGQWLEQNAHLYGFVQRYPQGKDGLTGWTYEPWHYRFVGLELAAAMKANNLCLEEVRAVYDQQQTFELPEAGEEAEDPAYLVQEDEEPAADAEEPVEEIPAEQETLAPAGEVTPVPETPAPPAAPAGDLAAMVEDAAHILLTNAQEPLPEHYAPENLIPLSPKNKGVNLVTSRAVLLREDAAQALYQMLAAADKKDLTIFVRQGYRSYSDEARRYQSMASTGEVGQQPGQSSYQTGLSVTLVNKEYRTADIDAADFAKSKEGKWLLANASQYGFVLRYPQGKEDVTGWEYEPWHFRYVGVALAQKMTAEGLTMEELREMYDAQYTYVMPVPATPTPIPTATPRPTATPNPWVEYYSTGETGPDGDYEIDLFPELD